MESSAIIVISLLVLAFVVLAIYAYKMIKKNKTYEERFSKIIDIDKEFEKLTYEKQKIEKTIEDCVRFMLNNTRHTSAEIQNPVRMSRSSRRSFRFSSVGRN